MFGKGVVTVRIGSFLFLSSLVFPLSPIALALSSPHMVYENEYIVGIDTLGTDAEGEAQAEADLVNAGVQPVKNLHSGAFLVTLGLIMSSEASNEPSIVPYRADDTVCIDLIKRGIASSCSPNFVVSAAATPNDPSFSSLWGLSTASGIDAARAWDLSTGSNDVIVAVIDTGVDYTHPDLAENLWVNPGEIAGNNKDDDGNGYVDDIHGINVQNGSGNPYDDNSHGTHVSGTISARGNNGAGVVGVNWKAKIMGLKFLSASGSGSLAGAIEAINYAVMMKNKGINLRITNNSWGGGGFSQPLHDAIARARDAGIIFVAAAGNESNDNDNNPAYPASYDLSNVISVAAIDQDQNIAGFSNYGAENVDIAAPGVGILSTTPRSSYQSYSGTSMATPHVSGALALLLASDQSLSNEALISRLYDSGVYAPALDGLVRTARTLNVARMVFNETTPLPVAPPKPQPCQYLMEEIGFSPDKTVESEPIVLQADELTYHTMTLPFVFPLHREESNSLILSPNGVIYTKRAPALLDYINSERAPLSSIAALHSDLTAESGSFGVRVRTAADRADIYWKAQHFSLRQAGAVEIWTTLHSNGVIESYLAFESSELEEFVRGRATLGLSGSSAASAITFAYNNRKVRDRLGVRYTPLCSEAPVPVAQVSGIDVYGVNRGGNLIQRGIPGMPLRVNLNGSGSGTVSVLAGFNGRTCPVPLDVPLADGGAALSGVLPRGTGAFERLRFTAQAVSSGLEIDPRTKDAKHDSRRARGKRVGSLRFQSLCEKLMGSFKK